MWCGRRGLLLTSGKQAARGRIEKVLDYMPAGAQAVGEAASGPASPCSSETCPVRIVDLPDRPQPVRA